MNWLLTAEIIYVIILIIVSIRIIYDTRSHVKALAWVLCVIFLPVLGMILYFSFGINYRKRKMYSKKLFEDDDLARKLQEDIFNYSKHSLAKADESVQHNRELAHMLVRDSLSPLTADNSVELLINGEKKFPSVFEAIRAARKHIHIEYYIYEDGEIGRQLEQLLIEKARQGVTVRFIYDDYGSRSIRKTLVKRLRAGGVQAFPFHKVLFIALANRLNYRNHRKIIVIDGQIAFVGGINVSDRYINCETLQNKIYWRDTHIRIEGPGVYYLQYIFMCDWNFCANEKMQPNEEFFPKRKDFVTRGDRYVQIAASGPDSDTPTILFSLLQAINLATKEILITTPYFIPGESLLNALIISSLGGVKVKLLVPYKSDTLFVDIAARSYFDDLLRAGVEIYRYRHGFIHAKTLVADGKVAIVGTANLDSRSFDLNFEVNAIVYGEELSNELKNVFYNDLQYSERLNSVDWEDRPVLQQLLEKSARLLSPLL